MVKVHSKLGAKLNVLITEDRPHAPEHWSTQLPRLLEPQGVAAYVARSGREAIEVAHRVRVHAAVVDWGTPIGEATPIGSANRSEIADAGRPTGGTVTGLWLLELFRRLPHHPPVVVVGGPVISQRQFDRLMRESLRLGVFSVVNKPVDLEQMLTVFRRMIDRRYRGAWPLS